ASLLLRLVARLEIDQVAAVLDAPVGAVQAALRQALPRQADGSHDAAAWRARQQALREAAERGPPRPPRSPAGNRDASESTARTALGRSGRLPVGAGGDLPAAALARAGRGEAAGALAGRSRPPAAVPGAVPVARSRPGVARASGPRAARRRGRCRPGPRPRVPFLARRPAARARRRRGRGGRRCAL